MADLLSLREGDMAEHNVFFKEGDMADSFFQRGRHGISRVSTITMAKTTRLSTRKT